MRRGSRGKPKVCASALSSFCCDEVSASLRPSASRALASTCTTSSFFSPRCGTSTSTLRPLDGRERGEPVAIDRGALVVQRRRGLLHFGCKLLLHRLAFAGEKGIGLAHQLGVFGELDLVGAGRRAALDLMQQARPRAVL